MSSLKKNLHKAGNIFLFTSFALIVNAQHNPAPEYQLKAAFIYNFTQFVEWPINTFSSDQLPMVIGILGEDPFGPYLVQAVSGERKDGHSLVIRHYKSIEEVKDCHILFINLPSSKKMLSWIQELKKQKILTVGNGTEFIKEGGMIAFVNSDNKIRLQINPEAAREVDLTISSKLLRLADIIVPVKK